MIRIQQIKQHPGEDKAKLIKEAAKILRISEKEIRRLHIVKRSLDARKKPELFYSYVVDVETEKEDAVWKRAKKTADGRAVMNGHVITREKAFVYQFLQKADTQERPVIIGMGPAGLFCAYFMALAGYRPLLLERGKCVEERQKDVEHFWESGDLNPESNVQFGEGGAGTFSDGKLNTLVKDKYGRNKEVLRLLVKFGAPEDILYEGKPHVGTDILRDVVRNMRKEIIRMGGEVRFQSKVTELLTEAGEIRGVVVNGTESIVAKAVILAVGHSARDTFSMLLEKNVPMEAKPFAVGFRVEHSQQMMNESQYGAGNEHMPAAVYKVAAKSTDGRGVYSFCMCPGGYVVNASSEEHRLCVNGMSYSGRNGKNANSAIIVAIGPEDFGTEPLAGVRFQRELEEKAYRVGNGKVPVQTYLSFKAAVTEKKQINPDEGATFAPAVKGSYTYADLTNILPEVINIGLIEGMEQFAKDIKGFNRPDTLFSAVESRTSSPVRIIRDADSLQSGIKGLYPCGEGAGYAGGITSAAMDGIKVAEAVARDLNQQ
ncbi:MAG: NAD(P)/FAD-dependent oxidoreductase [Lachnospiraceae bacterium]